MLELKRIHILGFKSFCDKTDVSLDSRGVTAIVGPNGCGKSNISDAISWVLGEQSAKSLRGAKMEDVIFSGTRERKPTGMAEVTLVLVDPEVYQPATRSEGPIAVEDDWDEAAVRSQAAQETEAIIAELQPGQIIKGRYRGRRGGPVRVRCKFRRQWRSGNRRKLGRAESSAPQVPAQPCTGWRGRDFPPPVPHRRQ